MTDQFGKNNINLPRGSRLYNEDAQLNLDDDLVTIDTADAITLTLPDATQIPGQEITFKAGDAITTVTIAGLGTQTIDGLATVTLTSAQESLCLKSDGDNWRQVCAGGGGGSTCCAPVLLVLPNDFEDLALGAPGGTVTVSVQATKADDDPNATALLINDATNLGADLAVTDVAILGTSPQLISVDVQDQSGGTADGAVWVVLQNSCGCCQLIGRVQAGFG